MYTQSHTRAHTRERAAHLLRQHVERALHHSAAKGVEAQVHDGAMERPRDALAVLLAACVRTRERGGGGGRASSSSPEEGQQGR